MYTLNTIYNVYFTRSVDYHLYFVLGLICSQLMRWYWRRCFFDEKPTFPKIKKAALLSLPVPPLAFRRGEDRHSHQQVVKSVTGILRLHKQLASARTPQEIRAAQREITSTDRQIDQLVYELYGLTDKEIRIVEEATKR